MVSSQASLRFDAHGVEGVCRIFDGIEATQIVTETEEIIGCGIYFFCEVRSLSKLFEL